MKYSEWILEQSISTADVDDVVMESCLAEMDVCCEILNLYAKRSMIMEYADPTSDIYQEAAENTGDAEKADAGETNVKDKWYVRLKNWFVTVWNKIVNLFTRSKFDKLLKIVKESDAQKYEWNRYWGSVVDFFAGDSEGSSYKRDARSGDYTAYEGSTLLELYSKFGDLLLNNQNDIEQWELLYRSTKNRIESRLSAAQYSYKLTDNGSNKYIIMKDQMIGYLERLSKAEKTDLPEVNKLVRNIKKNNRKSESRDKENERAVINKITQISHMLNDLFSKCSRELMQITTSVVKGAKKTYREDQSNAKKAAKEAEKANKKAEKEAKKNLDAN